MENSKLEKYFDIGKEVIDFLNKNSEISGKEKKSCKFLEKILLENGYEVTSPYKGVKYSFKASKTTKSTENKKYKIAILCEYDATEGIGHACGHSASSASSIISALALQDEDLPFEIDIIGTPNEEVLGGKIQLLEKTAFKEYDLAIMAHMNSENQPYFNTVASCDLNVSFYGRSAHTSINPYNGINALNGVKLMFSALDMMGSSLEKGQSVEGIITDGGKIPNIIPKKASAYIYLRASDLESLNELKGRVIECIKGVAKATETTNTTTQNCPEYAGFFWCDTNEKLVSDVFEKLNMPYSKPLFQAGSSDIGNLSMQIPVIHPMIAISDNSPALYTEEFAEAILSESGYFGMKNGAKVIYNIVLELSNNLNLFEQIISEHKMVLTKFK